MNKPLDSPRPDNRIVAYENEFKVLKLVRDFGHLRRVEVARGVWPHSSPGVAETMAQRTIARLTKSTELFETSNALGGMSLVLGRRGATRLRNKGTDADAGYDLSSVKGGQFQHRSYGTRYLIERIAKGHRAFSEYALSKGWSPITRDQLAARFRKVPDGLVLVPGPERGYNDTITAVDWIEVENTPKSGAELARILDVAWNIGECLDAAKTVILDRVVFVFDRSDHHERRIERALRTYLRAHPTKNEKLLLSSIVLCRCTVDFPFVWREHEEVDCGALLQTKTLPDDDCNE
jgi:hypothetical protein